MKLDDVISTYAKNLASHDVLAQRGFPSAPPHLVTAGEFVDLLISQAAEHDVRAFHPFMRNLAAGRYPVPQLQEWVRQGYLSVMADIRRHTLIAAAARECDLLRSLLSYVSAEADADPVGGTFFSLPHLWIKFGISLGLTREQIVGAQPSAELLKCERAATDAVSGAGVPVSIFVDAILDSALASYLGKQLQAQLGCARDSLDYFWAIAGNRWGEDVGRSILELWSETGSGQQNVWARFAHERASACATDRLSATQAAVESISHS
jgi:hypothetical protein